MYKALIEILTKLPENTKVYNGHEYTVNNLKFGAHAEPDNEDIKAKLAWTQNQRAKGKYQEPWGWN